MKTTEWFPPEIKPVHIGVYEVQSERFFEIECTFKAYWNGKQWNNEFNTREFIVQNRIWRGIIK